MFWPVFYITVTWNCSKWHFQMDFVDSLKHKTILFTAIQNNWKQKDIVHLWKWLENSTSLSIQTCSTKTIMSKDLLHKLFTGWSLQTVGSSVTPQSPQWILFIYTCTLTCYPLGFCDLLSVDPWIHLLPPVLKVKKNKCWDFLYLVCVCADFHKTNLIYQTKAYFYALVFGVWLYIYLTVRSFFVKFK